MCSTLWHSQSADFHNLQERASNHKIPICKIKNYIWDQVATFPFLKTMFSKTLHYKLDRTVGIDNITFVWSRCYKYPNILFHTPDDKKDKQIKLKHYLLSRIVNNLISKKTAQPSRCGILHWQSLQCKAI